MGEYTEALKRHKGNKTKAAKDLGLARSTFIDRLIRESAQTTQDDETAVTTYEQTYGFTVEDVVRASNINTKLFTIERIVTNRWEVAGKKHQGQNDKGHWLPQELWSQPLHQIKIYWRRKAPKLVQQSVQDLLADFKFKVPKVKKPKFVSPKAMVFSLYDAHYAKLCWARETGQSYDLDIASCVYANAVEDLVADTNGMFFDRIYFPIGNDFFNANAWSSVTAHGTEVESVDDRFKKVFRAGVYDIAKAVHRLLEIAAEVEIIWCPGNHDLETSWYLCEVIDAMFRDVDGFTYDRDDVKQRKYRAWENCFFGFTHGDKPKKKASVSLPMLMALEAQNAWGLSQYREIFLGHFHHVAQSDILTADEYGGVRVRIVPALSGVDLWHYENGFVGSVRAAQACMYDVERTFYQYYEARARI